MPQDQSERRKHVRRAVLLPCKVEGAWAHGTMQIVDLSVGGCFVATRETIPAGTQITLHATLAGTEVRFTGRVVHMQGGRGFALEFGRLANDARQLLEQFLDQELTTT